MGDILIHEFEYKGEDYRVLRRVSNGKFDLMASYGLVLRTDECFTISAYCMAIDYGIVIYHKGCKDGRLNLQAELRDLLNVPFLEANPS